MDRWAQGEEEVFRSRQRARPRRRPDGRRAVGGCCCGPRGGQRWIRGTGSQKGPKGEAFRALVPGGNAGCRPASRGAGHLDGLGRPAQAPPQAWRRGRPRIARRLGRRHWFGGGGYGPSPGAIGRRWRNAWRGHLHGVAGSGTRRGRSGGAYTDQWTVLLDTHAGIEPRGGVGPASTRLKRMLTRHSSHRGGTSGCRTWGISAGPRCSTAARSTCAPCPPLRASSCSTRCRSCGSPHRARPRSRPASPGRRS